MTARDPASPTDPDELLARLGDRFEGQRLQTTHARQIFLDTSDRRLAGADLLLWLDRAGRRLAVVRSAGDRGGDRLEQGPVPTSWPRRLDTIPDGPVRRALAKPVGIRALLPYVELSVDTTTYAVLDDEGKTVARIHRSRGRIAVPARELPDRVEVEALRGYERDARRVARRLGLDDRPTAAQVWAEAVREVPVPGQPPQRSAPMTADEPADVALAQTLLQNLNEMEASLAGIRGDLDIEYLHDFRVAVRRTRSLLKLLGDMLPDGLAERFGPEFRWLGQVTTPGRDLDVYVGELPDLARALVRPADLDPFAEHVTAKRRAAYTSLQRSLRSARFRELCRDWRVSLETVITSGGGSAGLTAGQLADQRIHRTFRKVARRARAISAGSESEEIHDLRKACKELRYLLEMFKPLCDPATHKAVTADFKGLQDVLGDFQDGEVQAAALREFADEMLQSRAATAATLLSMGELAAQFDERQRSAREKLLSHHMTHLGRSVTRHIDHVVANRGDR